MFGAGAQLRTRRLWSVTTTGTVANDRVTGISGVNPQSINEFFTNCYFAIRVIAKAAANVLTRVNIYGASDPNGFPASPTNAEVLCSTATDIALNNGVVRVPAMNIDDGSVRQRILLLPKNLMLEYSSTFSAGGMTFVVDLCAVGPWIIARE